MRSVFGLILTVLATFLWAAGCRPRGFHSTPSDTTGTLDVMGSVEGSAPRKITEREALALQFVSHGKIPTWEGVIVDWGTPQARVHIVDTKSYDGHFGYVQKALGRGHAYTQDDFFVEVQFPDRRRYMPFLAFDFRAKPIDLGGRTYNWVLQTRRYNFRDTDAGFADVLVAMKQNVLDQLFPGKGEPVLLAYDNPPPTFRRPHISNLTAVHAKGFVTMTENQMIEAAGASLVSVLNPGVGMGYLKLVKSGAATERLTPRHIAIFEDTPERVPPVAGIFTLEPQTPLSHVNLLAKNRGTVNVSTPRVDLVPGLAPLIDKLVKVEATADGSISVAEVSLEVASAWWKEQAKMAIEITSPDPRITATVEFASAPESDLALQVIGSKASNYASIQKLLGGALVKPGFAIGFGFYRKVAQASGAQALIDTLLRDKGTLTPEEIDARLVAIRKAITDNTPADATAEIVTAIRAVGARLPGIARIRFRSSTNCEDLPQFNGAGLYESEGFNLADDDAKLLKKLLAVTSSLWLERAFWEREFFGIDHSKASMAILINPAFKSELANGVVITSKQEAGFSTWINAQKGDALVTNPAVGDIPESFVISGENLSTIRVNSRSNLGDVFLDPGAATITASRKEIALELTRASQSIFGFMVDRQRARNDNNPYGVDIEYKIMEENGKQLLWIKQARLLSLRAEEPADRPQAAKKAVAKDNGMGGAHLRRAPKQLADLPANAKCVLPANAVVAYDRMEEAGQGFVRLNVTIAAAECPSFFGGVYVYKSHFNFVD